MGLKTHEPLLLERNPVYRQVLGGFLQPRGKARYWSSHHHLRPLENRRKSKVLEMCQCIGLQHAAKVRNIIYSEFKQNRDFQVRTSFPPTGGALRALFLYTNDKPGKKPFFPTLAPWTRPAPYSIILWPLTRYLSFSALSRRSCFLALASAFRRFCLPDSKPYCLEGYEGD